MIFKNTQEFKVDSAGKVIGVKLQIKDIPGQQYKVSHLRLIDEYESNGRTVAYCSVNDGRGDIYLTYPFDSFQNYLSSGGNKGEHVISNSYNPNNLGPLSICVGRPCISQLVMGLGLPAGRHVSYEIVFSPVSEIIVPSNLEERVARIENFLRSF